MIVALILADKSGPDAERYFTRTKDISAIEQVVATAARGPFSGTIVDAHPTLVARVKTQLNGFTLQYVEGAPRMHSVEGLTVNINALKAVAAFRARWEKVMAAATGRFKQPAEKAAPQKGGDWAKHKQNPDVKIRGLASSFDRDGVMLIPADATGVTKEKLAQWVEEFSRSTTPLSTPEGVRVWDRALENSIAAI